VEALAKARPEDESAKEALFNLHERLARVEEDAGDQGAARDLWRWIFDHAVDEEQVRRAVSAGQRLQGMDPSDPRVEQIERLARSARRARWSAGGLAALSGLLLLIAAPPRDLWPVGLLALAPLLWATRRVSPGQAAFLGWVCGMVVNLGVTAWALPVLDRFGQVSLASRIAFWLLNSAYQASSIALWAAGARAAALFGVPWLLALPLTVLFVDAVLPSLFPGSLAIVIWRAWPLLQVAELGGSSAVSALLVTFAAVTMEWLAVWRGARRSARPSRSSLVLIAVLAIGGVRAGQVAWARSRAPHLRVGIVQPNEGILGVQDRRLRGQQLLEHLRDATDELGSRGAELVVWPESAFPFLFDRTLAREFVKGHPWQLRTRYSGPLLIGALTHSFGTGPLYNSAVLIASDGKIAGTYDKTQLLAFGEYVPFADHFPEWAASVRLRLPESPDIEAGTAPAVLETGRLKIGPLICYEDLFADHVGRLARQRPNLLVTLANHAWFGASAAPHQALALAVLRGIEVRRDLVRATNTGVTSISDALGRVRLQGELHADQGHPQLFVGDVALLETTAAAPYTASATPWLALLTLLALLVRARRRLARCNR